MIVILLAAGALAIYHLSRPNIQGDDDVLKYCYIKMKGEVLPEQIATLEDIFGLNCNSEKIEQMREDVGNYEEVVRKQAAIAEQARPKEQAGTASGYPNKKSKS